MGLPAKEGIFIQAARELVRNTSINKPTFQALDHLLGIQLTIDFVVTVGYYSMLSQIISALDVDIDSNSKINPGFHSS